MSEPSIRVLGVCKPEILVECLSGAVAGYRIGLGDRRTLWKARTHWGSHLLRAREIHDERSGAGCGRPRISTACPARLRWSVTIGRWEYFDPQTYEVRLWYRRLRFAFYLHFYDPARPLESLYGLVECPTIQPVPVQLKNSGAVSSLHLDGW